MFVISEYEYHEQAGDGDVENWDLIEIHQRRT